MLIKEIMTKKVVTIDFLMIQSLTHVLNIGTIKLVVWL